MTLSKSKNMFGGCESPTQIYVKSLQECVDLNDSRARRAMIRMLRRPIDAANIRNATQTTGTCWFFAALVAMFLSDMGRVSNIPLRETMILGKKGYRPGDELVEEPYRYPLLVLNQTIHLLLDGEPSEETEQQVKFEDLVTNQRILVQTEAHLEGLRLSDYKEHNIFWHKVLNLDFQLRKYPFSNHNPLAFLEAITHLCSQVEVDSFRHLSEHHQPIPESGDFATIVRHGVIRQLDLRRPGYVDDEFVDVDAIVPLHKSAAREDNTPKTSLNVGGNVYILDAMILASRPIGGREDVRHATACIHLNKERYWFDSNDDDRPKPRDWYKLLRPDSQDIERPLGQSDQMISYNIQEEYSILLYQKLI